MGEKDPQRGFGSNPGTRGERRPNDDRQQRLQKAIGKTAVKGDPKKK